MKIKFSVFYKTQAYILYSIGVLDMAAALLHPLRAIDYSLCGYYRTKFIIIC